MGVAGKRPYRAVEGIGPETVAKPRRQVLFDVLPLAVMGMVCLVDIVAGPKFTFLQLLSLGPALAAGSGLVRRTIVIGIVALMLCEFLAAYNHLLGSVRNNLALATVLGVTVAGAVASAGRQRREHELANIRAVAEVAQRVLLRPVPQTVGPLQMAMRYISATADARIGGDLYEVVTAPCGVRVIIGDVQGKGLAAVETAAMVVGAFREAAYDACDLLAVAARLEAALIRNTGAEEFVTAILLEIRPGVDEVEVLNCGHPAPLVLCEGTAQFVVPRWRNLPLGLAVFDGESRHTDTISFDATQRILLYTDGISEARDRAGDFYPLDERGTLLAEPELEEALDRLHADVLRHVGETLNDDAAMLLLQRRTPMSGEASSTPAATSAR